MIFVTIGSMLPFDRLIRAVDGLAPAWPNERFFAQIGQGEYEPVNMEFARMLSAREFGDKVSGAKLIIAHAGMGSVISAMEVSTPIVILPRLPERGEVTTGHQVATARWLSQKNGVYGASDETELANCVARALTAGNAGGAMSSTAPEPFLQKLRGYLAGA